MNMFTAKDAILTSLRNSNKQVYEFICILENEIISESHKGNRYCNGEINLQDNVMDINISDVIEYFELLGYEIDFDRSVSAFNQAITYKVKIQW